MEMLIKIYDQDDNVLEITRCNCDSITARRTDTHIVIDTPDKKLYIDKKSKYVDCEFFFDKLVESIEEKKDFKAEFAEEETDNGNFIYPLCIYSIYKKWSKK